MLIDTNVLLSAALRDRRPERVVLHVATRDDVRWIVTPEILAEYTSVLRRPNLAWTNRRSSAGMSCSQCEP